MATQPNSSKIPRITKLSDPATRALAKEMRVRRNRDPEVQAAKAAAHAERIRRLIEGTATGWSISEWLEVIGWSKSKFFALPTDKKPRSVVINRSVTLIESPGQYLARLAAEAAA